MSGRRQFFEALAAQWDELSRPDPQRLAPVLAAAGLGPAQRVLDVGCGTGVLVPSLAAAVGPAGAVTAVDFAPAMVEQARARHRRLAEFVVAAAEELPFLPSSFDVVICLSVFPHFADRGRAVRECVRVLAPGGRLVIAHLQGRAVVNAHHTQCGGPVAGDLLPPANEVALLLEQAGLDTVVCRDEDDLYLVVGELPASGGS